GQTGSRPARQAKQTLNVDLRSELERGKRAPPGALSARDCPPFVALLRAESSTPRYRLLSATRWLGARPLDARSQLLSHASATGRALRGTGGAAQGARPETTRTYVTSPRGSV